MKANRLSLLLLAFTAICAPLLQAKPLKVFILAGQSNMEDGSAKFFGQAGKAFAEALVNLKK